MPAAKEYDYLLSMPLWSLTLERVEDLQKSMNDKDSEYKALQKLPITDLWENDLQHFLEVLEKHEEKEEKDRMKHKPVHNDGKKNKGNKNKKPAKNLNDIKDQKSKTTTSTTN